MKTKKNKFWNNKTCFLNIVQRTVYISLIYMIMTASSSCRKFVEVAPPINQIAGSVVFADNKTAAAAVTDIYSRMSPAAFDGVGSLNGQTGLSADEFITSSTNLANKSFFTNALTSANNSSTPGYWNQFYNYIYLANACIEGLTASNSLSPSLKQQLLGESKFIRALCHFYLVNLYGDVPLVITTDYRKNNVAVRTPKAQVYSQIIQDLQEAQNLLGVNYLDPSGNISGEKLRPNKIVATALLARVYLYTADWENALTQSTSVIANTKISLASDLNQVFEANSSEAIWQLQPTGTAYTNTYSGYQFILSTAPDENNHPLSLNSVLINAFEPNDKRFINWVRNLTVGGKIYYYPFKYNIGQTSLPTVQYFMVLRLAEQYLIRAEAEAQLGDVSNLQKAINDINVIRARAGLAGTTAITQPDLLTAIQHERQVELFTEIGHRWLDLKRTGLINTVMGPPGNVCAQKGGTWNPSWALYPIPNTEIQLNPNLIQNPGY